MLYIIDSIFFSAQLNIGGYSRNFERGVVTVQEGTGQEEVDNFPALTILNIRNEQ